MNKHRACYNYDCPKNCNCYCTFKPEERLALSQKYNRNIYCLTLTEDGIPNFSYKNNPLFQEYCEYLDSLKVIDKLKGDTNEVQR